MYFKIASYYYIVFKEGLAIEKFKTADQYTCTERQIPKTLSCWVFFQVTLTFSWSEK